MKIYNRDCLEGMKELPEGTVDMILVDPPFGTTDCEWDKKLPLVEMWEEFLRVAKENAAIVLFSQMPFGAELIMSQPKLFRYEWIWEKALPVGFLNARRMPLRAHENILIFYRKLPKYNPQYWYSTPYSKRRASSQTQIYRRRKTDYSRCSEDGKRYPIDILSYKQPICGGHRDSFHPTQKPVDLLEYLIRTYTDAGETVLDATMGSGSTGVACAKSGREFIGYETDPKYYEIAAKRIEHANSEKELEIFNFWEEELECGNSQED